MELASQTQLQYAEQGDTPGRPLILLHGYVDSGRTFERVLPYINEPIHTFALTQRGHGDASRPAGGYRIRDFVADLAAFMERLDLKKAVIMGGSSGGIIARKFAIDHPDRTQGLIMGGAPFTLQDKPAMLELWKSTISKLKDPIDPRFVRSFMSNQIARPVPQTFLKTMLKENLKVPARVWKATLKGLLEDKSSEELNNIRTPTLIVWGDKDEIVPRRDQEKLQEGISGSKLIIYSGAGHMLYWEEPARFASDIVTFMANLRR